MTIDGSAYDVYEDSLELFRYTVSVTPVTGSVTASLSPTISGPYPDPSSSLFSWTSDTSLSYSFTLRSLLDGDSNRTPGDLTSPITVRLRVSASSPLTTYGTGASFSLSLSAPSPYLCSTSSSSTPCVPATLTFSPASTTWASYSSIPTLPAPTSSSVSYFPLSLPSQSDAGTDSFTPITYQRVKVVNVGSQGTVTLVPLDGADPSGPSLVLSLEDGAPTSQCSSSENCVSGPADSSLSLHVGAGTHTLTISTENFAALPQSLTVAVSASTSSGDSSVLPS
ncbi:hypothetical protein TeGR_g2472, partial [Tetraparma gracilis]